MREDKWAIFGAGEVGISAFAILKQKISFFIDDDEKNNYIGGLPVIPFRKARERLKGVSIILGTINPVTEEKIRSLLSEIETGPIFKFYELCHIVRCREYDFSPILEEM